MNRKHKSNIDYHVLRIDEDTNVMLDPKCPESIEWYLTEVCGYPTEEEILAISPDGVLPDYTPCPKRVAKVKRRLDGQIKKASKRKSASVATGKACLFLESSRDAFFEKERTIRSLQDDSNFTKGV